eukprot:TRINITY_DN9673_c0_g1_i1.p1 TRINITY_DN9673_c0_g1~~TRINITY_DN9673_c0_g1_i1.p1  ORF type:complete len:240 (-),score=61.33 TRINITY_DN9673_c0_g1_i1:84-803(-)
MFLLLLLQKKLSEEISATTEPTSISQGHEPGNFWTSLHGSQQHYSISSPLSKRPKMYLVTYASGRIEVDLVADGRFSQDDLTTEIVAILDTSDIIYIWFGKKSPYAMRKLSLEITSEYAKKTGRTDLDKKIIVVEAYSEPLAFKSQFHVWSYSKYPKNVSTTDEKDGEPVTQVLVHYSREVYSYEELISDNLPPGVDATKLEIYLSDDEFEKVFNMTRKQFEKILPWKREGIKQKVYLY